MTQVTIHEAKTHLSKLIQMVLDGEEVIIAKRDKPLVKLVLIAEEKPQRQLGLSDAWIEDVDDTLNKNSIRWLPITPIHCQQITTLPKHHGDPFDRMLIAQALVEGMTLMTADAKIQQYTVLTLW